MGSGGLKGTKTNAPTPQVTTPLLFRVPSSLEHGCLVGGRGREGGSKRDPYI